MIRYPGSKDKIVRAITQRFPDHVRLGGIFQNEHLEYREPFVGSGAVAFSVINILGPRDTVWLNDLDYGICCLWNAVYDAPDELCSLVRAFIPSVDQFYRFRADDDLKSLDPVEIGFRKLALHQTSFSGLGARAGGPIGGRRQSSAYNVNCRWNAERLCRHIRQRHHALRRLAKVTITAKDFDVVIGDARPWSFIYADPPYVEKGGQLYKHSMDEADHRRLAAALRRCRAQWVLSYDDHPLVRSLYSWAQIEEVVLTYTTAVAKEARRKNSEVIISPIVKAALTARRDTKQEPPYGHARKLCEGYTEDSDPAV